MTLHHLIVTLKTLKRESGKTAVAIIGVLRWHRSPVMVKGQTGEAQSQSGLGLERGIEVSSSYWPARLLET